MRETIMELYIGGCAQGKLDYVRKLHKGETLFLVEGESLCAQEERESKNGAEFWRNFSRKEGRLVICGVHRWIRALLDAGENPKNRIGELVGRFPDCILISDEIGNGIVPAEPRERKYREETGRILTGLAEQAVRVERVICGIGQRLK